MHERPARYEDRLLDRAQIERLDVIDRYQAADVLVDIDHVHIIVLKLQDLLEARLCDAAR